MDIVDRIEKERLRKTRHQFQIGDTVDVHVRIREGDKERVQVFTGVVIRQKGSGTRETFTVRRIVQGEGVERIYPMHSPVVEKVVVRRGGVVRRAKLYYLRERAGKKARLRERLLTAEERDLARRVAAGETEPPEEEPDTKEINDESEPKSAEMAKA